ncbi:LTA synthase family protein [Pseudoflavonifractor sp.]|jgi:phosphoglycerol transferase MdoB-like AlkP superfamily enzyme|uniref:LTA synthase family protein n=1 Tax=Pseudoflavonifractor sp. TaxID=1980281 RepID=UPI003D9257BC
MKKLMQKLDPIAKNPVLTPVLCVLMGVCIGVLSLWFACVDNRTAMFISYFTHPLIALLNILPVVFLSLLLYFLIGRAWISYLVTAALTMGLTFASFYKLTFRNDPMMFEDILLIREAGNMAGKYQLFLNKSMVMALVLLVLGLVFLLLCARAKTSWKPRLLCALVTILMAFPLYALYTDANIYNNKTRNEDLISPWSATQVYTSKGFLYPFLYSIRSASDPAPEDYDAKACEEIMSGYTDADIPEEQKVDIFTIQLEAYNDFTKFGTPELNPEVYRVFHELESEGYTGNLVTNIFAGGTIDTERCFLTGYSSLGSFRSPSNSYAWYFRDQGYYATGSHSCYAWFYNRENINANLGLEDYKFVENYYGELTGGGIGYDDVLFPEIINLYEEHKANDDRPYFSFNVTYQGHGPYDTDRTWYGDGWVVDDGSYTQEELNLMNNYFGSLKNTGDNLEMFFDYFRESEDPVVIVLFGDHNPWMGDANSVYNKLGIDLDLSTKEGFMNYYATRYLIWANDAAKEVLGCDFQGEGPDLSPNFLMTELFDLCGWEGPAFMQATRPVMEALPVINTPTGLYFEDGNLTKDLTDENQALADRYDSLQYYWRKHFVG